MFGSFGNPAPSQTNRPLEACNPRLPSPNQDLPSQSKPPPPKHNRQKKRPKTAPKPPGLVRSRPRLPRPDRPHGPRGVGGRGRWGRRLLALLLISSGGLGARARAAAPSRGCAFYLPAGRAARGPSPRELQAGSAQSRPLWAPTIRIIRDFQPPFRPALPLLAPCHCSAPAMLAFSPFPPPCPLRVYLAPSEFVCPFIFRPRLRFPAGVRSL